MQEGPWGSVTPGARNCPGGPVAKAVLPLGKLRSPSKEKSEEAPAEGQAGVYSMGSWATGPVLPGRSQGS